MRILLVEDEQKIANAIKKGLEQERYAVDLAFESESGLDLALAEEYDVIILDIMLPGNFDGLDICRQIREKKIATPILMLTAKDTVTDRVSGLDQGADDYLIKPFAFDELLARIRALLRRPAQNAGDILKIADLSLDTTKAEVTRAGKTIDLSSKEYALLEFLMRNQNQILTKEKIINHVWDFDADVLPNTVEVYIGYLRSKIDKPFHSQALIHTKRGFGYKLGVG